MDSITSSTPHGPASWTNNLRAALAASGASYALRCVFDVGTANALLSLDCVPADDKRQLKAFVRTSTRDTSTGLQATVSNYDFSKRCKAAGQGRLYTKGHPGMATLPSSIRNAIFGQHYFDLDISNSQPHVLLQLAKRHSWACDHLDNYVTNREHVLTDVMQEYGVSERAEAKKLVIAVINSGLPPECLPGATNMFLHSLRAEVGRLAHNIYTHSAYAAYAKAARTKKGAITCLSDVMCDVEFDLLMEAVDALHKHSRTVGGLMMDGCAVLKDPGEESLSSELIGAVERHVLDKTGFTVVLDQKPMDTPYAAELAAAQQQGLPAEFEGLGLLYQEPAGKRHQPDKPAANLLQQVIGADLRRVLRYTGPSMPWQHYDSNRGVWMPIDASYAASVLQELYMAWHDSDDMRRLPAAYWSAATHERMLNLRTAREVLALMTGFLHDPYLWDSMDTMLAEGLIPFANTCVKVEAAGVLLVPHSPENYISKTVEYELPLAGPKGVNDGLAAPPPWLDFSVVDRFYETYWVDQHKRATVMKTVAATLLPHMRSRQKFIIIGTDTADGNTGKSVWGGVLLDVMSVLAQPLQPALVYDSASLGNRNGHGANELSYHGAYMAVLDEMKAERRFDMEA